MFGNLHEYRDCGINRLNYIGFIGHSWICFALSVEADEWEKLRFEGSFAQRNTIYFRLTAV
jgi:hypothetical protein